MAYHSLYIVIRPSADGAQFAPHWSCEFGDRDRETVESERDVYAYDGHKAKDLRIVTTRTPPSQDAVAAKTAELNGKSGFDAAIRAEIAARVFAADTAKRDAARAKRQETRAELNSMHRTTILDILAMARLAMPRNVGYWAAEAGMCRAALARRDRLA